MTIEAGATLHNVRGETGRRGDLSVGKSISISRGGRLIDAGTMTVKGNVVADDAKELYLYPDAKVDGNVKISPWIDTVWLASASVDGTVSIDHQRPIEAGTISINDSRLGELLIKDNKKVFVFNVTNNRIARRLECTQDRGQLFVFQGNTVGGKAVDESACPVP